MCKGSGEKCEIIARDCYLLPDKSLYFAILFGKKRHTARGVCLTIKIL